MRLLELLERLAAEARAQSLPQMIAPTGRPKPTVHGMLTQLESGGWLVREPDGRHYALAPHMLRRSEAALPNSTQHGVRHAVLRQLVAERGERCNLTARSSAEVVYLDRMEAAFPLRMKLRAGTRVPAHCSASGKLVLAWMAMRQREALEAELKTIRREGHAVDAKEFVEGLVCVEVPVFAPDSQQGRCALALQAPAARMSLGQAHLQLPRLKQAQAAQALARTLG